jgi:hypothetical protein
LSQHPSRNLKHTCGEVEEAEPEAPEP